MPAVECITYIICVCTYIYIYVFPWIPLPVDLCPRTTATTTNYRTTLATTAMRPGEDGVSGFQWINGSYIYDRTSEHHLYKRT
jgi:hypothetical protein